MFAPDFQITPALTKVLMDIEASRQAVSSLPVTVPVLSSLHESARLVSTHYSTRIEGNRLTQAQVADVIHGGTFPNRERDEREVKNYYQALDFLDTLINRRAALIAEKDIQVLHGLMMDGKTKATPYRDGQNVIRDSGSGAIVYMPPEAEDVPRLYDGNGRTARLLTSLVLHKSGYGLKGIYSLEEYYARNLQAYYAALNVGESHNYYFGRAEADISAWIMYFCDGMADAFAHVRLRAAEAAKDAFQRPWRSGRVCSAIIFQNEGLRLS